MRMLMFVMAFSLFMFVMAFSKDSIAPFCMDPTMCAHSGTQSFMVPLWKINDEKNMIEEGPVDAFDPMAVRYSVRSFAPLLSADLIESTVWFIWNYSIFLSKFRARLFLLLYNVGATDYHLHCDLPGVHPENLDITIGERSILIEAERLEVRIFTLFFTFY